MFPRDGVTTATLKSQVAHALGKHAEVHTGEDRGTVEDPSLGEAKETLMGIGGSFGGVATLVAMFTAAGTVALAVGQRAREFALLRAIGTTPRQVRRSIATETLLVAPSPAPSAVCPESPWPAGGSGNCSTRGPYRGPSSSPSPGSPSSRRAARSCSPPCSPATSPHTAARASSPGRR